ncbi:hypothetical protein DPEC_G00316730 [Dallia pectoralis]|uniref:Uncharacterized protein n=1 Tax=Dallia pectoralis TaxID=75939 RepID=A0ACC2FCU2_DALPE|nr:hypothetical protein DPEC_G00316730 [Dallia pectoralis]
MCLPLCTAGWPDGDTVLRARKGGPWRPPLLFCLRPPPSNAPGLGLLRPGRRSPLWRLRRPSPSCCGRESKCHHIHLDPAKPVPTDGPVEDLESGGGGRDTLCPEHSPLTGREWSKDRLADSSSCSDVSVEWQLPLLGYIWAVRATCRRNVTRPADPTPQNLLLSFTFASATESPWRTEAHLDCREPRDENRDELMLRHTCQVCEARRNGVGLPRHLGPTKLCIADESEPQPAHPGPGGGAHRPGSHL